VSSALRVAAITRCLKGVYIHAFGLQAYQSAFDMYMKLFDMQVYRYQMKEEVSFRRMACMPAAAGISCSHRRYRKGTSSTAHEADDHQPPFIEPAGILPTCSTAEHIQRVSERPFVVGRGVRLYAGDVDSSPRENLASAWPSVRIASQPVASLLASS
jgi:hypothetical protein